MSSVAFISYLVDLISRLDHTKLKEELNGFNIDQIDHKTIIRIVEILINASVIQNNKQALEFILEFFNQYEDDDLSLYERIFTEMNLEDETLYYIVRNIPSITFLDFIDKIAMYSDVKADIKGIQKALRIFSKNHMFIKLAVDIIRKLGNIELHDIIVDFVKDNKDALHLETVDIPDYLIEKCISNHHIRTVIEEEKTSHEKVNVVDSLTSGLQNIGIAFENNVENRNKIEKILEEHRDEYEKIKEEVSDQLWKIKRGDDELFFKIFGPVNILTGEDFRLTNLSTLLGGNRMFVDNEIETNEDNIDEDWFIGICQRCLKKIPYDYYAVREPILDGGWQGCYCSWDCVKDDTLEESPFLFRMIDNFKDQMKHIGILSRDGNWRSDIFTA